MFYEIFIMLCDKRGIKPSPVLKQLELSTGNLEKWKNGASVNSEALKKIASYFDVSIDFLLGIEKKATPGEQPLDETSKILKDALVDITEDEASQIVKYAAFLRQQRTQ